MKGTAMFQIKDTRWDRCVDAVHERVIVVVFFVGMLGPMQLILRLFGIHE